MIFDKTSFGLGVLFISIPTFIYNQLSSSESYRPQKQILEMTKSIGQPAQYSKSGCIKLLLKNDICEDSITGYYIRKRVFDLNL